MDSCKSTVLKIYNHVIDDVISGTREIFATEGIDEQVLHELKSRWESKLIASKAVDMDNGSESSTTNNTLISQTIKQELQQFIKTADDDDRMIPIQITVPTQPTPNALTRVLTIHIPTSLNSPHLHTLLTGPIITATMGLPAPLASSLLQQHVTAALKTHQQNLATNKIFPSIDVAEFLRRGTDGAGDSSDEEDCREDTSDDEVEEKDDDFELGSGDQEEEPLNSEDDVTDEEPTDLFETDNIVVCQYDRILRSRNKWKFYLKDGIMNLDGEDFVFQKASCDTEW